MPAIAKFMFSQVKGVRHRKQQHARIFDQNFVLIGSIASCAQHAFLGVDGGLLALIQPRIEGEY
ncbi:MAG TPA: hypothetical protein DEH22_16830 [Chloroflexi bacterium]|nr:hypothetical protein [Chloroflexota bacterium]